MLQHSTRYGISTTIPLPYEQALQRSREALAKEGFGEIGRAHV